MTLTVNHQDVIEIIDQRNAGHISTDQAMELIRKALTPPSPEDFTFPVTVLFADEQTRFQFIEHTDAKGLVIVAGDEDEDEDEQLELAARIAVSPYAHTITLAFEDADQLDQFARSVQERNAVSILTGAGNYYTLDADVVRP